MHNREELLKKNDIAKICGVSLRTVNNWINRRLISYVKFGKSVRFVPSDIQKFIASRKVGGISSRAGI